MEKEGDDGLGKDINGERERKKSNNYNNCYESMEEAFECWLCFYFSFLACAKYA